MSKLSVVDNRLPVDVSVYAYSRYKHNDMDRSATPAVAFTALIKNRRSENVTASLMFNLPLGIEPRTQRMARQMSQNVSSSYHSYMSSAKGQAGSSPLECFTDCSSNSFCKSWSYDNVSNTCYLFEEVRLNGHDENSFAGVKVSSEMLPTMPWRYIVWFQSSRFVLVFYKNKRRHGRSYTYIYIGVLDALLYTYPQLPSMSIPIHPFRAPGRCLIIALP